MYSNKMNMEEYFVKKAREENESVRQDNSHYLNNGIGAYKHTCPYRSLPNARTSSEYREQEYWFSAIRGIVYNGVARNQGWRYCKKCNPKELTAEEAVRQNAGKIILRYLRRKVPILKFKRRVVVFSSLHIKRGLPEDIVAKFI